MSGPRSYWLPGGQMMAPGLKRYKTEEEARMALQAYAKEHGLEPAY